MATCSTATGRRKLWTEESMEAAVLRRRVNGSVKLASKPGPGTILTEEE